MSDEDREPNESDESDESPDSNGTENGAEVTIELGNMKVSVSEDDPDEAEARALRIYKQVIDDAGEMARAAREPRRYQ